MCKLDKKNMKALYFLLYNSLDLLGFKFLKIIKFIQF